MKMEMKSASLLVILIIASCTMSGQEISVSGKIAIENSNGVSANLYFPSTNERIALRYDKNVKYGGLHWANTTDNFIGIEQLSNIKGRITRGNVVLFNLQGEITDTVYEAKENELSGDAYLSVHDNKLLFKLTVDDFDPTNALGQLNRPASIVVMDFKKKEIIRKIDGVASLSSIELNESPWFSDEVRFVYDIRGNRKMTIGGEDVIKFSEIPGIYLYDLSADSHTLLAQGGYYGVVSPVADQVAYIRDRRIWIYDLKKNTQRAIYAAGKGEEIMHIHWTPDGEYIYLSNYTEFALGFFDSNKKLIGSDDGREVPFDKVGPGLGSYTWK